MGKFNSDMVERNVYYKEVQPEEVDGILFKKFEQVERPLIVCLIGSSRFKKEHEEVQAKLGAERKIGIPLTRYGHLTGLDMDSDEKKALDELHLWKVDLADEVFVVNPIIPVCPQCGKPTRYDPKWGGEWCERHGKCYSLKSVAYIGESTRRELEYALRKGKTITYLNPPESPSIPDNTESSSSNISDVSDPCPPHQWSSNMVIRSGESYRRCEACGLMEPTSLPAH